MVNIGKILRIQVFDKQFSKINKLILQYISPTEPYFKGNVCFTFLLCSFNEAQLI